MGGTCKSSGDAGTVRAGRTGTQLQGDSPCLCQESRHHRAVTGGLRAKGGQPVASGCGLKIKRRLSFCRLNRSSFWGLPPSPSPAPEGWPLDSSPARAGRIAGARLSAGRKEVCFWKLVQLRYQIDQQVLHLRQNVVALGYVNFLEKIPPRRGAGSCLMVSFSMTARAPVQKG